MWLHPDFHRVHGFSNVQFLTACAFNCIYYTCCFKANYLVNPHRLLGLIDSSPGFILRLFVCDHAAAKCFVGGKTFLMNVEMGEKKFLKRCFLSVLEHGNILNPLIALPLKLMKGVIVQKHLKESDMVCM